MKLFKATLYKTFKKNVELGSLCIIVKENPNLSKKSSVKIEIKINKNNLLIKTF